MVMIWNLCDSDDEIQQQPPPKRRKTKYKGLKVVDLKKLCKEILLADDKTSAADNTEG